MRVVFIVLLFGGVCIKCTQCWWWSGTTGGATGEGGSVPGLDTACGLNCISCLEPPDAPDCIQCIPGYLLTNGTCKIKRMLSNSQIWQSNENILTDRNGNTCVENGKRIHIHIRLDVDNSTTTNMNLTILGRNMQCSTNMVVSYGEPTYVDRFDGLYHHCSLIMDEISNNSTDMEICTFECLCSGISCEAIVMRKYLPLDMFELCDIGLG